MTANKEIIRRLVDGVWGDRNLASIDELIAQDYIGHDPTQPAPIQGRDGFKQFVDDVPNRVPRRDGHDRRPDRRG